MQEIILNIICSFGGSIGFAIIFNIKGKDLAYSALGGVIGWMIFFCLAWFGVADVLRYFVASVTISAYSKIMAKIRKIPTTVFLVISFIPLVPGYSIYLTMNSLLLYNIEAFAVYAVTTFEVVLAIGAGFLVSSAFSVSKIRSDR
ncbi:MAG: threonine/serine exporter family protein [Bacillota bacterium]